jgi:hypothetical protein
MELRQDVGQCASSLDGRIVQFGQRFANIFYELNGTCRQMFEWISNHVFKNEEEWRSALKRFKGSVLESAEEAGCSRNGAKEIYQQVEIFLLNPTNQNVAIKSAKKRRSDVADSLMHFLTTTDVSMSSSAPCVVCRSRGGIIVSCSGNKCKSTLHTFCAAAVTQCKNPPSRFYRCPNCPISAAGAAAVEVTATKEKRRRKNTVEKEEENDDDDDKEEEEEDEYQNGGDDGASLNAFLPACSFIAWSDSFCFSSPCTLGCSTSTGFCCSC